MQTPADPTDHLSLQLLVIDALELADHLNLRDVGISLDRARVLLANPVIEQTIQIATRAV